MAHADERRRTQDWAGVDINEFPKLGQWVQTLAARPGVEKGRHVPTRHTALQQAKLSEEQLKEHAAKNAAWIQSGMKGDAK